MMAQLRLPLAGINTTSTVDPPSLHGSRASPRPIGTNSPRNMQSPRNSSLTPRKSSPIRSSKSPPHESRSERHGKFLYMQGLLRLQEQERVRELEQHSSVRDPVITAAAEQLPTSHRFRKLESETRGKSYTELLYEESLIEREEKERERFILLQMLKEQQDNDPECTFRPQISTSRAKTITQPEEHGGSVFDRLYKTATVATNPPDPVDPEATFTPRVSAAAKRESTVKQVHERLYIMGMRSVKREYQPPADPECTFSPRVSVPASMQRTTRAPLLQRLYRQKQAPVPTEERPNSAPVTPRGTIRPIKQPQQHVVSQASRKLIAAPTQKASRVPPEIPPLRSPRGPASGFLSPRGERSDSPSRLGQSATPVSPRAPSISSGQQQQHRPSTAPVLSPRSSKGTIAPRGYSGPATAITSMAFVKQPPRVRTIASVNAEGGSRHKSGAGISDQLAKLAESPKQHQAKTETHQRVPPKSPLSSPRAPSERVPALGLQAAAYSTLASPRDSRPALLSPRQ